MKSYIVYNDVGVILQTGTCPASMLEIQASTGRNVIEGMANPHTEFIIAGKPVPRPSMAPRFSSLSVIANGRDEISIIDLPAGAAVQICGPLYMTGTANGSPIALTFAMAGAYTVSLSLSPIKT